IFRIGKPAVIGDPNVPLSVLQYAEKLNVPLFVQGKDFFAQNHQREWGWRSQFRHFEHLALPAIPLQNAASALMITECLNQTLAVQRADIDYGLSQVFVPGRFQIIQKHCPVILDVAHNAQSARLLAENLQRQAFKGKTYAVFSALADKDLHGIVEPLAKFIDCWCYSDMQTPRAATKQQLKECLNPYPHQYYANLKQAYSAAFEMATAEDRVIVFGSFYVVASILPILL
ncbi:MAG: folC, partial [Gammaproteobacteria bacterium]|nr:folC [Gammaproteobacteria bacterium]